MNGFPGDSFVKGAAAVFVLLLSALHPLQGAGAQETAIARNVNPVSSPVAAPYRSARRNAAETGAGGRYYFMKRPTMGVRLTYEYKDETRESGDTTVKDVYHKFKEQIAFGTEGWLYHPALMKYSLLIEPEWSQAEEEMTPGEKASSNGFSPDYYADATFLEQKPYTLRLFAGRQEIPVWAAFAGNTESIVDSYGGNVLLKYKTLPTNFGYSHIETDQSGFYTSSNIRDYYHLNSQYRTQKSHTSLTSSYNDDQRTSEGIYTAIRTFNNTLLSNYRITEDNRINLASSLIYRSQDTTNLDSRNLRIREHLNWRHRENLQSNYSFTYDNQKAGESDSDKTALDARLSHRLYDNLTTNVGSKILAYNYSGGRENSADAFLDFAYRRPLSWGTLNLNAGWDYIYTDRGGFTEGIVQITNESHTLNTGEETFLDNYNVEPGSIIVTNSSGTIVYAENIDYTIDEIDNYIRITRSPFGAIEDGQLIEVNYRFLRDPEYDDTVFTQNYGIDLDFWNRWQLSYHYLRATQNILSGVPPEKKVDDTIHRARLRYDLGWSDTLLTYENNDRQSDLAYDRWELSEMLRYRPTWRLYFTLKGYYGQTTYKEREEEKDFYGGVSTFDWLLTRWCKFRVEGYYDEVDGNLEKTANTGVKAGLEFRYRIWTARFTYELTDQDNIMNDYERTRQLFRFEIIRIMW